MIRPALACALSLAASAAFAEPAMTAVATTMRAAPSPRARPVQQIPANAQIDVGECGERWCEASWRGIEGYVRVEVVAPNDAPLYRPPPAVAAPWVVGPTFGFGFYRQW
jgi:uncharacterized protein YraI